jgi:hemerythrin
MGEEGPQTAALRKDRRHRGSQETKGGPPVAFINWTPAFSVGIPVIDDQHKILIALINELHAATLRGEAREVMERTFQELVLYAESHFKCEEGFLRQVGYPFLVKHHVEHREFVVKVQKLYSASFAIKFMRSMDLLVFLRSWWGEHILVADQKYVPFLNAGNRSVASRA